MLNTNNYNNSNARQNIWDQMALFNQLTLHNILNGRNDLSTPELRAAVAAITDEQRVNALMFLYVTLRNWQDYLMGMLSRPLQMYIICWTTIQQLSPMQGVIQLGLLSNLLMGSVKSLA